MLHCERLKKNSRCLTNRSSNGSPGLRSASPIYLWVKKHCRNFILLLAFFPFFRKEIKRTFSCDSLISFFPVHGYTFLCYATWRKKSEDKQTRHNSLMQQNCFEIMKWFQAFRQFISLPLFVSCRAI